MTYCFCAMFLVPTPCYYPDLQLFDWFMFVTLFCLFFFAQQEAFTKAAGKKSKTSVELDLGDMLAALEKHQQAMKARQLTNTKPLSFTGTC